MAKDPAFLFYYQDFLVGTTFLTHAERGAYITILCHLADKGSLHEDEIICLCNGTFSAKLKSKLQVDTEGKYYNKRLLGEVIKRKEYAISRRNNRLGKDKKKKHMKKICKTYDTHMENEDIDENEAVNRAKNIKEFETIWSRYPNKVGMKSALKHYKASVKTKEDITLINKAIDNYLASKRVARGFIMNGSTFFNQWQDWVEYTEPVCKKCKGKGKFISTTGYEIVCDCEDGKRAT